MILSLWQNRHELCNISIDLDFELRLETQYEKKVFLHLFLQLLFPMPSSSPAQPFYNNDYVMKNLDEKEVEWDDEWS